jgi:hypothetical protein
MAVANAVNLHDLKIFMDLPISCVTVVTTDDPRPLRLTLGYSVRPRLVVASEEDFPRLPPDPVPFPTALLLFLHWLGETGKGFIAHIKILLVAGAFDFD